jgi:hypothetical protein
VLLRNPFSPSYGNHRELVQELRNYSHLFVLELHRRDLDVRVVPMWIFEF